MLESSIVVLQSAEQATDEERQLAARLNIPLQKPDQLGDVIPANFFLQYSESGLGLGVLEENAPGALTVDFNSPKLMRRSRDSLKKQGLGKALGLNRHQDLHILDATAGTGTDAFLMAAAGCSVTLLERSRIVAELLRDALARGAQSPEPVASAVARMDFRCADFLAFNSGAATYDVVYLDPMFPDDSRSARSQKAMYILQQLLGKDEEEARLLDHAMTMAKRRVVVKRNRRSPTISERQPDIQFKGSSSRYDVYLPGSA